MELSALVKKIGFNSIFLVRLFKRNIENYFVPAEEPNHDPIGIDSLQWIGHSTTIININGIIIVTDPILGSIWPFKRKVRPSMDLSHIHVDYILLSHGHMDHLEYTSLLRLNRDATLIVPKGYGFLKKFGFKDVIIAEEHGCISLEHNLKIHTFPANHDGRRYYLGNNGYTNAYLIDGGDIKVFFGGDTAFTDEFNGLESSVALLPVGCYVPSTFEKMHCTPIQSYNIFKSMNSNYFIPIHYNTFIISLDDDKETLETLKNLKDDKVLITDIGKTINLRGM